MLAGAIFLMEILMPDTLNAAGLALNRAGEQCRLLAYDDRDPAHALQPGDHPKGRLTIGWGHTGADVRIGLIWTQEEADTAQAADLAAVEASIRATVNVKLTDNQFGALVDFAYNAGTGAFAKSRLLRLVNAGKLDDVPAELAKWIYSKGVKMPGLVKRRAREALLWTTPDTIPVLPPGTEPSVMPDPVRPPSLFGSVTLAGAAIAGSAPVLAPILSDTAGQLQPLVDYAHAIRLAFLGCSVGGACMAAYGRIAVMRRHGV